MKKSILTLATVLSLLSVPAYAEVPLSFTHHGVLREGGFLVNGQREITATILDEAGNIVGQKTASIDVDSGLYTLIIDNIDVAKVVVANRLTLNINVDGDDLTPALDITSVPYALAAKQAAIATDVKCDKCISLNELDFNAMQDSALPNCEVNQVLRQADGSSWVCSDLVNLQAADGAALVNGRIGINIKDFVAGYFSYALDSSQEGLPEGMEQCFCDVSDSAYECGEAFTATSDQNEYCWDNWGSGYRVYKRGDLIQPHDGVAVDGGNVGIGTGTPQAPLHISSVSGAENYEVIIADTQPEILLQDLDGTNYKVELNDGILAIGSVDENGAVTPLMSLDDNGLTIAGNINADGFGGDLKIGSDAVTFNYAASNKQGGDATSIADGTVQTAKIVDKNVTKDKLAADVQTSLERADKAVLTTDIGTVTSTIILDGTVATIDLADNAVTSAKIADGTITSADLGINWALGSSKGGNAKVADLANSIKNGIVTTDKIVNQNVTIAKLESSVQTSLGLADNAIQKAIGSVTSTYIQDGTITSSDLNMSNVVTALLDYFYPVGSIKVTVDNVNPQGKLGGTWVQYGQGTVLMGVDNNIYKEGQTGGSTTASGTFSGTTGSTVLTVAQMPSHTHTQNAHTHIQDAHTHTQNAHTHTQVGHTHTFTGTSVNTSTTGSHYHYATLYGSYRGRDEDNSGESYWGADMIHFSAYDTPSSTGTSDDSWSVKVTGNTNSSGNHYHSVTAAGTNATVTPTINSTTAVNQTTVAVNKPATATNNSTGGGQGHTHTFDGTVSNISTIQPYTAVYFWKRTK